MTTEIDDKILKRLEKLGEKAGTLPGSLEFYRKLLSIQSSAKRHIGTPRLDLSPGVVNGRIAAGRPSLEFNDLDIDWPLFRDTFKKVGALLSTYSGIGAETGGKPELPASSLEETAKSWFEGKRLPSGKTVKNADEELREHAIQAAFSPFLISHRDAVSHLINKESWRRGYCPICGGSPDFAFLDKERGGRWLLCSLCDAEWLYQRLGCPYCGTQNQNALSYFTDDKGLYRLYVCEQCRRYLKAIDLRQTEDEILLPLERWLTLDLDIQAQNNGYEPPAGEKEKITIGEAG